VQKCELIINNYYCIFLFMFSSFSFVLVRIFTIFVPFHLSIDLFLFFCFKVYSILNFCSSIIYAFILFFLFLLSQFCLFNVASILFILPILLIFYPFLYFLFFLSLPLYLSFLSASFHFLTFQYKFS